MGMLSEPDKDVGRRRKNNVTTVGGGVRAVGWGGDGVLAPVFVDFGCFGLGSGGGVFFFLSARVVEVCRKNDIVSFVVGVRGGRSNVERRLANGAERRGVEVTAGVE